MITEFPATTTMTVDQALNRALRDELKDVLICGYNSSGELVVRSSRMTLADANWLIDMTKMYTLNTER